MEAKVERKDFLKKIPLFGAGLALSLTALADADETPKIEKLTKITGYDCNQGDVTYNCNTGSSGEGCTQGKVNYDCNQGIVW